MKPFTKFITERIHTAENDPRMVAPDLAYKQNVGSMVYKVTNQNGIIILTTDGLGNTKYTRRKELISRLRQIAYTPTPHHDYMLSNVDHSKDKKWTFSINNKPVVAGSPKDVIQFLLSGPIREETETEEEEPNREREDKPPSFVIIDKITDRVHSKHRSRADVDKVLQDMPIEDRKQFKVKLEEAAYQGNIGFMELYHFHNAANVKEKGELDNLIRTKKFKEAWQLVQKVTKTKLVGKSFG